MLLGVERLLWRISLCRGAQAANALEGTWWLLDALLSIGNRLLLLVMGGGLFAMMDRLPEGFVLSGSACLVGDLDWQQLAER